MAEWPTSCEVVVLERPDALGDEPVEAPYPPDIRVVDSLILVRELARTAHGRVLPVVDHAGVVQVGAGVLLVAHSGTLVQSDRPAPQLRMTSCQSAARAAGIGSLLFGHDVPESDQLLLDAGSR